MGGKSRKSNDQLPDFTLFHDIPRKENAKYKIGIARELPITKKKQLGENRKCHCSSKCSSDM